MSVLGMGLDVVGVADFSALLGERGSAFTEQVFTVTERAAADRLPAGRRDQHLAARFAAKEAFVKAWSGALPSGAPLVSETESWAGIEVTSDPFGRPVLDLRDGVAAAVADSLGAVTVHLSLTHEPTVAAAVVVLTRPVPAPSAGGQQ